jgi:hypothetical protein
MLHRRGFVLSLTTSLVALVLVVGSVVADELMGTLIKVNADAKQVVVVPKDSSDEIQVKVTDKTEQVTKKGTDKLDLTKLEKSLQKALDKGAKGLQVKVTHENRVASKIERIRKKSGQ